jgi:hypothetical protein
VLSGISEIVSIVGFPLALMGIFLAYRDGRNSRDLEAALTFSDAFTDRWSSDWRDAVMEIDSLQRRGAPLTEDLGDTLVDIINWLDSVGLMIDSHLLARPNRVLSPIKPSISKMFIPIMPIIAASEVSDRPDRWRGVRILGRASSLPAADSLPRPPHPTGMAPDPSA